MQYIPIQTLNRYYSLGEELKIGNDIETGGGPTWTFPHLNYTKKCNNKTNHYYTEVRSQYLYVKTLKNGCRFAPTECGVHYCKLLSPAHAMEWMYIDGLRFNMSLKNSNMSFNIMCNQ